VAATPQVSIIIPVRNDAEALARTMDHFGRLSGMDTAEVIVAGAGDREETERVVRGRARLLWPDGSTRALLMNAGAARARGSVLFFLHADSFPPPQALPLIAHTLSDPHVVGGAFEHRFLEPHRSLRTISWINRRRYRLTSNYYGDQGIFVRAEVFRHLGGYRDMRILEDLDFSRRLRRLGGSALIQTPLLTSGRRFLARGPWRTFVFIVWLLGLHTIGLDTQRYAERWRGPADRPPGSPWPRRSRAKFTSGASEGPG
jgi:rSAM/selenodomain-associated transferase 2